MPRIYTSTNDPLDFCSRCFPNSGEAHVDYAALGHGPDGRGNCFAYDAEHPSYGGEGYTCEGCGRELTDDDNHTETRLLDSGFGGLTRYRVKR